MRVVIVAARIGQWNLPPPGMQVTLSRRFFGLGLPPRIIGNEYGITNVSTSVVGLREEILQSNAILSHETKINGHFLE